MRYLPASRINAARLDHCLVSDGCVISAGTTITRCVIGIRTQIGSNVTLRDSVLIGADRYDIQEEREENQRRGLPNLGIGDGSVMRIVGENQMGIQLDGLPIQESSRLQDFLLHQLPA